MYMLIRYFDGRLREAILLSLSGQVMRVAIPGTDDAVEFTLRDGQWVSDENGTIEIEFLGAMADDEWHRLCGTVVAPDEIMNRDAESGLPFRDLADEGRWTMKPFAVQLYERLTKGESIEQLAVALNIPVERIAARIRAAEDYIRQQSQKVA